MTLTCSRTLTPRTPVSARRRRRHLPGLALLAGSALALAGLPALDAAAAPTAALPLTAAVATGSGPLPASGCAVDPITGAASCDLYARAGTVGLATAVPVWGFASATATVTAPGGPTLVVDAGQPLQLTVHNELPAVAGNLSLAVPQLRGLAPDTAGVPAGQSSTYTWTSPAPGTYLYEAGHTPGGARQTAMGLYGALVVRGGAAPTGGGPSAYGTDASGYDDESVVVLGEVDPAFNAAPMTYDVRRYAAKYRLMNGHVAPSVPTLATAPGHRLLLRYVDAGSVDHVMTLLGNQQTLLATGGVPEAFPVAETAVRLSAGETQDTVVTLPAAAGLRYSLYEQGNRLDNDGALASDGTVALGGMVTDVDTGQVVAGDTAPPTVSGVTVSPPVTTKGAVTVHADVSDTASGGSTIARVEYVLDNPAASAPGSGSAFSVPTGQVSLSDVTASVSVSGLAAGGHSVYVRAQDSAGNWGVVSGSAFTRATGGAVTRAVTLSPSPTNGAVPIALQATGDDTAMTGTVTAAEYFVGTPGGPGTGTPMTLASPGAATTGESASITLPASTPQGPVVVSVETKDSFGYWGPRTTATVLVDRTGPTTSGVTVTPTATNTQVGSAADITSVRVDATVSDAGAAPTTITAAELYLDAPTTPVPGSGAAMVPNTGAWTGTSAGVHAFVPVSQLVPLADGPHTVSVRGRDAAGNWGTLVSGTLTVDRALFANGWETGTLAGSTSYPWNTGAAGGRLAVTRTGALAGTWSMQYTAAANSTTGSSVGSVGYRLVAAEPTYRARFTVNPQTLGNGTVDLFEADDSSGVTALKLQLASTRNGRTVSLCNRRGTGYSCTPVQVLTAGAATTVTLAYTAGTPASLTVGSAAPVLAAAAGSSANVLTARLGVMAPSAAVTGTALFDGFSSARYTLP